MTIKTKKTTNNLSERVMTSEKLEEIYHKINFGEPLKRHESIWFKNISGVRKNGIQWGWTQEELEEYTRCKLDVHYFAENYCKIKREDGSVGKIQLRPYQKDILDLFANNRYSILCASRQSGKAQPLESLLWTDNGPIKMGDIKVNDKIYDETGNLTNVTAIYPQGLKDIYEITFSDGSKVQSCEEHLWGIETVDRKYSVKQLKDFKDSYLEKRGDYKYFVKVCEPVKYSEKEFILDPYLIGLLLGDGGLTNESVNIATIDDEIISYLESIQEKENVILNRADHNSFRFARIDYGKPNKLKEKLKQLGLMGKYSYEKFIPKEYKYGSIEQRLALLQGLMDTDGSVSAGKKCCIEYSTSSQLLADDICELAESLGIIVRRTIKKTSYKNKEGIKIECRLAYRIKFQLKNDYPYPIFRLTRKQELLRNKHYDWGKRRGIAKIEFIGKKDAQCISVDNESHLYLTNHYIPTHNTISASIFILHYLTFNQDKGICIAANKAKTTQEILDKIKNIYKQLPFFLKVGLVNWGAKTLSFENGCRIMTEARSKEPSIGFAIDLLYLDEFAHIPANYIEPYYKSVVPTVSSIQNSKIIITSTPNGFNLFHKIWEGANLPKGHPNKNPYKALKVLWYEVTDSKNRRYREDAWLQYNKQYMDKNKITEDKLLKALKDIGANLYVQKQADEDTGEIVEFMAVEKKPGLTIDDLRNLNILNHKAIDLLNISSWSEREIKLIGGKENFDQEYNLHFLAGSKRVLEPETLELISKTKLDFVWKYNSILEKRFGEGGYDFIRWHPELYDSIDFKNDFIFASVDLAEGLGQDYTVFNIFKLFLKEKDELELKGVKQIQDAFQLKQIGILHTNRISVDIDAPEYFYTLFFEVFNPIKTKIALEYNTFGSTLVASLQNVYNSKNKFGKYIFIKYKHRIDDEKKHIGIKLNSENKKIYVKNYVIKLHNNSVIIYEMNTANEINNFVKHETNAGNYVYRAEIGHDDIVMSLVHACTIPDERCFIDACKMFYNNMDSITRNLIKKLLGYKDTNNNVKSAASILTGAKKEAYGGKYNKSFESREGGRYSKYLGYE